MALGGGENQDDRNRRLIARNRHQQQQEAEQRELQEREAIVKRRIALRDATLQDFLPKQHGGDGSLGKAAHLAEMSPEGLAGRLMAELILFILQLIFNTPHLRHKTQFSKALKEQLDQWGQGNPIHLVYMQDADGNWPTVYKIDSSGNIDFNQAYPPGEAPNDAVRLNGLVPKPNFKEGLIAALDEHMGRMYGESSLSKKQQLRIRNLTADVEKASHSDSKRDIAIRQMMQPRPTPRAR